MGAKEKQERDFDWTIDGSEPGASQLEVKSVGWRVMPGAKEGHSRGLGHRPEDE